MAQSPLPFDLTRILSFDLKLDKDHKLRHLGAVLDQQVLSIKGNTADAVSQLEQLAQQSDMILGHPLHQRLSSLQVDMPVQLKHDNNGIIKIHHQNNSVAQLSTSGQSEWHDRMPHIKAASVIAIIQRSKEQEQGKYKESARVENWELPIVQIEYEE
ncbi:hypothetical protein [Dickeya zeae]|uniref:hypothetical protein n=1 Tax=Dickeya zeae TaxID=204042 RepID=UPI002096A69F|nr:hypothetical protein [Dickeya zeae]MCO7261857.1 hypothetical protein [Dickeya zeae]